MDADARFVREIAGSTLRLVQGDITRQEVDVIVNAANSLLMGGGGVDGAIHRGGGPEILAECQEIFEAQGKCPAGQAVVTTAGKLPARWVVHAVGPVWSGGGRGEEETLCSAYRVSLRLAVEQGARSVAFPSISTGAYRFPIELASRAALATVAAELAELDLDEVRFVLFSAADLGVYAHALRAIP